MKRQSWNILGNMFEVKTRRSFKKAFLFSQRHYNALNGQKADPYIEEVFNGFAPSFENFHTAFSQWNIVLGFHKGAVQDLNETLLSINHNLKEWEGQIFFHYPEGTSEAKAIFPHKRTPFYKGSHIARTNAVGVLTLALQEYPVLASVKTKVENFHTLLDGKLQKRLEMEGAMKKRKSELEIQRKKVTTAMYGNLGLLMHYYRERIRMLKVFFDMGVIKNKVRRKKRVKSAKSAGQKKQKLA